MEKLLSWLPESIVRDARVSLTLVELQELLKEYTGMSDTLDLLPEAPFGERLRALREASGLTTEDVSKRVEVASSTVRHWEHGSGSPSFRYIAPLAELFGVAPAQLFPQVPAKAEAEDAESSSPVETVDGTKEQSTSDKVRSSTPSVEKAKEEEIIEAPEKGSAPGPVKPNGKDSIEENFRTEGESGAAFLSSLELDV